jgi:hypothetical protein
VTNVVALGRVYVRLIEAARVMIGYTESDEERARLESLVKAYLAGLRKLLGTVSPEVAAQILAASEKVLGSIHDSGLN